VNRIHTLRRSLFFASLAAALSLYSSPALGQPRNKIVVAAAANLTQAFAQVGTRFEAETGIHVAFSFASTAQIEQQAENGAPFDVLAAADTEHIDILDKKGLLVPGSRAIYAQGVLALWVPPGGPAGVKGIEDLTSDQVKVIAVAKPELAPYGAAAVAALKKAGIWDRVQSKIVYAENINMAREYGASGNADAVLTAYALVLHEKGMVAQVNPRLYPPIDQALGVLASSPKRMEARRFVEYILRGNGRTVLGEFGYRQVSPSSAPADVR
jgi:molybdate transport system substrate-binding protein